MRGAKILTPKRRGTEVAVAGPATGVFYSSVILSEGEVLRTAVVSLRSCYCSAQQRAGVEGPSLTNQNAMRPKPSPFWERPVGRPRMDQVESVKDIPGDSNKVLRLRSDPAASEKENLSPRSAQYDGILNGDALWHSTAAKPGTETSPDVDVEEKLKEAFSRGWSVIVWNDPVNLMDYVVYVFKAVLKMNEQDASRHMWEVHQKGKSAVARETREKSELIVHRLRGFGLNATMEQA